jgi:hypothetical protein
MQPTKEYFQFVLSRKESQLVFTTGVHNAWPSLLEDFVNFLRGAGYHIGPGEYVEDFELVSKDRLEHLEQIEFQHSPKAFQE